ncbi:MAG: O-antigen ligase family protein [Candidatus Gracilibacteria bacterium]
MNVLFLTLLLLLGFGILIVLRKNLAFFSLPMFFIAYKIKLTFFGIPWNVLEIFIDALFFYWLVSMLLTEREVLWAFIKKEFSPKSPTVLWGLFVFVAALGILTIPKQVLFQTGIPASPIETFDSLKTALGILKTWLIPAWLFIILARFYCTTLLDGRRLLLSYVLGAFFVAALSLIWRYILHYPDTIDDRLGGVFVSANYLIFFVAPAMIYTALYILEAYKALGSYAFHEKQVQLFLVILPVLTGAFLLGKSYGSWIAVGICLLLYGLWNFTVKQKIISAAIFVLLAAGLLSTEAGSKKFTTFFETQDQSSTSTRLEVYDISTDLLKDNWLTGIGVGQYEAQYKVNAVRVLGKTPYEWVMLHPHNLYLSIWLSVGIFGLLLFLIMLWDSIASFFYSRDWLFFTPLLYILLHGVVDTPFWKMDMILIFVMLYVVLISLRPANDKE